MNRADKILSEFPPGVAMPAQLRELCDFLDAKGYPISGYMRLRPEGEAIKAWFGPGSVAWKMLAGFGSGPDGSIIAFWIYEGRDIYDAPIVHLESEGNQLRIIANNIDDFLKLFGIGYGELGFDDLSAPPEEPESAESLRQWLKSTMGIVAPTTGIDIITHAERNHPNFENWVMQLLAARDRLSKT